MLLVGCLLCPGHAGGSDIFSIDAYYKSFFVVYHPHDFKGVSILNDQPDIGVVNNLIRLNLTCDISETVTFKGSYNLIPRIRDNILSLQSMMSLNPSRHMYRCDDLNSRLYPSTGKAVGSFAVFQNLDRACLNIGTSIADFSIGRQSIAWGMAHVTNPTDIVAPYSYEELDTEDRVGVDGIRMRAPLGFMGELDAGILFGDDFDADKNAWFVRCKYYHTETDFSVIISGFRENLLLGFNAARSVGGAGFWLEGAHVLANNDGENDYLRLSTGFDYSFGDKIYGFIEYHYNGAGSGNSSNYRENVTSPAYTDGGVYLLGKHYLIPGVSYQLTPLITFSAEVLTNINDPSGYLTFQGEYNISENIYISAGAFLGIGERPDMTIDEFLVPKVMLNSEFGAYPDIYYTSFKVYF